MGARSYIIPRGSMSVTDEKEYRQKALAAGVCRALEKNIGDSADVAGYVKGGNETNNFNIVLAYLKTGAFPRSLSVRDAQPILDFGCALDQWNTAALALVGTAYSTLQAIGAVAMNAVRLFVWYGVSVQTVPPPVSRILFRTAGIAGPTQAVFDMEPMFSRLEMEGYFSEPVIWDPSLTYAMQVLCRIATGAAGRVILLNYTLEPSGQTQV